MARRGAAWSGRCRVILYPTGSGSRETALIGAKKINDYLTQKLQTAMPLHNSTGLCIVYSCQNKIHVSIIQSFSLIIRYQNIAVFCMFTFF